MNNYNGRNGNGYQPLPQEDNGGDPPKDESTPSPTEQVSKLRKKARQDINNYFNKLYGEFLIEEIENLILNGNSSPIKWDIKK